MRSKTGENAFSYKKHTKKKALLIVTGVILCLAAFFLNLLVGSSGMSISDLVGVIFDPGHAEPVNKIIVWQYRLPMAVMGILAGFVLGLAGATMQTILNNPLASPYTLGVSAGASVGASLAIVLGLGSYLALGRLLVPACAFVFAFLACAGIYFFARVKNFTSETMVLVGIGMVFLFQAVQTFIQYMASAEELQTAMFWTFGSLSKADWFNIPVIFAVLLACFIYIYSNSWNLTAMKLGDEKAKVLGVDIEKVRMRMFVAISLMTSVTVAFVGCIGFIGIIGPHIARMLIGEDQRFFLPFSCVCGTVVLSFASLLAKIIVPGSIFPIGIITSILGVPFYFVLLISKKRKH